MKVKNSDIVISLLVLLLLIALTACDSFGQSTTTVSRRCPGASPSPARAKVDIEKDGDILLVPCSTKTVTISGTTAISGTGTANHLSRFTAAATLGNSPLTWNGTLYTFQNTAETGTGIITFTPAATANAGAFAVNPSSSNTFEINGPLLGAGTWGLGDVGGTGASVQHFGTTLLINGDTAGTANIGATTATTNIRSGAGAATQITLTAASDTLSTTAAIWDLTGVTSPLLLFRTVTAGGTTGNQTINRPNGTVNFAAAATTITITNSTASATSTIFITPQRLDATCRTFTVDAKGAGTFNIITTAACTAETAVAFLVFN